MASPRLVGESDFPEGVLLRRFPSRIPIERQGAGWKATFGARNLPRPFIVGEPLWYTFLSLHARRPSPISHSSGIGSLAPFALRRGAAEFQGCIFQTVVEFETRRTGISPLKNFTQA